LGTPFTVNTCLEAILDQAQKLPVGSRFSVAMDMEQPIDMTTGIQGCVLLISIAFDHCVYLILVHLLCGRTLVCRLSRMLCQLFQYLDSQHLKLPHMLLVFLHSSLITKYGVHILHGCTMTATFKTMAVATSLSLEQKSLGPLLGTIKLLNGQTSVLLN